MGVAVYVSGFEDSQIKLQKYGNVVSLLPLKGVNLFAGGWNYQLLEINFDSWLLSRNAARTTVKVL